MRIVLLLFLMTISFSSSGSFPDRPREKQIIEAFLGSPEIIRAQEQLRNNANPKEIKILLYDGMCGAAGCQYSALVAQKFERKEANPFTTHILGRVHIGTKGNITRVERVGLVPYTELTGSKDADQKP